LRLGLILSVRPLIPTPSEYQLTDVSVSTVQGGSSMNIVPALISSLQGLTGAFQTAQSATSLTSTVSSPLSGVDVSSLTSTLQSLQNLVPNVQSTLTNVVSTIPAGKSFPLLIML
jgi:hypothetical protein